MTSTSTEPTALIVGASRGLGLGLVERHLERGWSVVATVRARSAALEALGCDRLRIETLDMTDPAGLEALAARLDGVVLRLLFVNAGICNDPTRPAASMDDASFARMMLTNALAPLRVMERFAPAVPAGGILAAMSSGLGSVSGNRSGGYEAYRASKAALNTLLRSAAARDQAGGRHYLSVDPGWVRTEMGGPDAPLDVDTSTRGIADMLEARLATGATAGGGGSAFVSYQDREVAW